MMRTLCLTIALLIGSATTLAADNPRVLIKTTHGDIIFELYPEKAPLTVDNFLRYVNDGFYNGTLFHRVVPGFVAQGGGLTFDYVRKPTRDPIINESDNGLKNQRGAVAMARTPDPDSATAQFFINLADNPRLNDEADEEADGYAVFARVVDGMKVADTMADEVRNSEEGVKPFMQIITAKLITQD